jgi:hypothetical protein
LTLAIPPLQDCDAIISLLVGLGYIKTSHGSIGPKVDMFWLLVFEQLIDFLKCQALSLDPESELLVRSRVQSVYVTSLTMRKNVTTFQLALMMYIRQPIVARPMGMT